MPYIKYKLVPVITSQNVYITLILADLASLRYLVIMIQAYFPLQSSLRIDWYNISLLKIQMLLQN